MGCPTPSGVSIDALRSDSAAPVLPSQDLRGQPMLEPDGSVPRGVVFFNHEDAVFQGVRSTGEGIVAFTRATPQQWQALQSCIVQAGGPAAGAIELH